MLVKALLWQFNISVWHTQVVHISALTFKQIKDTKIKTVCKMRIQRILLSVYNYLKYRRIVSNTVIVKISFVVQTLMCIAVSKIVDSYSKLIYDLSYRRAPIWEKPPVNALMQLPNTWLTLVWIKRNVIIAH